MKRIEIYECLDCGAVVSSKVMDSVLETLQGTCPFCRGTPMFSKSFPTLPKKVFDSFSNARRGSMEVEAVFVEYSPLANPRLVVRLADDYFHSDKNMRFPSLFVKVLTRRGDKNPPCPIEIVHHFDVSVKKDRVTFANAVSDAFDVLIEWVNKLV